MKNHINVRSLAPLRFKALFSIAVLIFAAGSSTTEAAEWRLEPVLRVGADFDDNPFLSTRTDSDENASGYIGEGSLNIAYAADRTDFQLTPRIRSRSYDTTADLDSDDQFLRLAFTRRGQYGNFRFRTNYGRESVRTAERADPDFDIEDPIDIPDDESGEVGNVDIRGRRERLHVTPSFTYRTSDVSSFGFRIDHHDVQYDERLIGSLIDYTDSRLELSYRRNWTPRNTAILAATYRNYQADLGNSDVDGTGINVGFDREISETTRFRATAGIEDTDIANNDSEVNWVANVSLSRQLQTINLLAQYRRSISASGSGRLGARDQVNLNFTRALSDRFSAGIGARAYITNPVNSGNRTFDERSYVQLRSQFTWNMSENFAIEANYRYTFLDRETEGESSNSNQITIWFTWTPTPLVRSR